MSSAIAAAKRRRAFNNEQNKSTNDKQPPSPQPNKPPSSPQARPQTIQEFIQNIDSRINSIETRFNDVIDEYETRFTLLAEEIANMKDVIIKVQSFSMEINKDLHNERIRVLSDMDSKPIENIEDTIDDVIDNTLILKTIKDIDGELEEELPTFS